MESAVFSHTWPSFSYPLSKHNNPRVCLLPVGAAALLVSPSNSSMSHFLNVFLLRCFISSQTTLTLTVWLCSVISLTCYSVKNMAGTTHSPSLHLPLWRVSVWDSFHGALSRLENNQLTTRYRLLVYIKGFTTTINIVVVRMTWDNTMKWKSNIGLTNEGEHKWRRRCHPSQGILLWTRASTTENKRLSSMKNHLMSF